MNNQKVNQGGSWNGNGGRGGRGSGRSGRQVTNTSTNQIFTAVTLTDSNGNPYQAYFPSQGPGSGGGGGGFNHYQNQQQLQGSSNNFQFQQQLNPLQNLGHPNQSWQQSFSGQQPPQYQFANQGGAVGHGLMPPTAAQNASSSVIQQSQSQLIPGQS